MGMGWADMSKVKCEECGKEIFNKLAVLYNPRNKYSKKFCTKECKRKYAKK